MQRAEDSFSKLAPEPSGSRPSFSSPWIAFALITILGLVTGGLLYISRPDPAPATPAAPIQTDDDEPDFSLTNEEAIARFEKLNELRLEMYQFRDISLAPDFLATGSPLRKLATKEISQLLNDRVVVMPNFKTQRLVVEENEPSRVRLRHAVIERPVFRSESGGDRTRSKPQLRVLLWDMRLEGSTWKLFDVTVLKAKPIN